LLGWHILPKTDSSSWANTGKKIIHHQLFAHAIWINNEGQASCVTKANLSTLTELEKNSGGLITEGKRQFILFAIGRTSTKLTEIPKTNIGIQIDESEIYIQGYASYAASKKGQKYEYKNMNLVAVDQRIKKHLIQDFPEDEEQLRYFTGEKAFDVPSKYTGKSFAQLLKEKGVREKESNLSPSKLFNMKKVQPKNTAGLPRDLRSEILQSLMMRPRLDD